MPQTNAATDIELDTLLSKAKMAIKQNQIELANTTLQTILVEQPQHRDALYFLAVCLRREAKQDDAFDVLNKLLAVQPANGRAFQEFGHNYVALNEHDKAAEHFRLAVSNNPSLVASWAFLAKHFEAKGDQQQSAEAQRHVQYIQSLPPELVSVSSLLHDEKIYQAEQLCRHFLKHNQHHPEAMRLLAEIGVRLQILDDAEFLLEKCLEFYPDFHHARSDYVQVLTKRQKFEKALREAQTLYELDKANPVFELSLATCHQAVGNFDQALSMYHAILERDQSNHSLYAAQGHALKTVGRTDDAISSYQAAYKVSPDYGDAYWSLANLKVYQFSDSELNTMREQQAKSTTSLDDKIHLCFALGKALEDRQSYDESFRFYDKGNQLKRDASKYKSQQIIDDFEQQKRLFDRDFFEQRRDYGEPSAAPIFIVGLPRAGSTLLEQILASHSQVDGTMELANIIGFANRLGGRATRNQQSQYPEILDKLQPEHCLKLGQEFIRDTQIHRQGGVYFIDKMPNNFRHIPLMQLILPNAKIIDARREPMACCFSGFKQLFAEGQEFTYGLDLIGDYYHAYVGLMNHWDQMIPGRILRVQHEDVLVDLEGQVARILDHCGLPFEQACVDFHKTERAVRTPSSEQVRQPIYKSSMQQWQHYETHLQPLTESLGASKTSYR